MVTLLAAGSYESNNSDDNYDNLSINETECRRWTG
jgi:hypothetical protein